MPRPKPDDLSVLEFDPLVAVAQAGLGRQLTDAEVSRLRQFVDLPKLLKAIPRGLLTKAAIDAGRFDRGAMFDGETWMRHVDAVRLAESRAALQPTRRRLSLAASKTNAARSRRRMPSDEIDDALSAADAKHRGRMCSLCGVVTQTDDVCGCASSANQGRPG